MKRLSLLIMMVFAFPELRAADPTDARAELKKFEGIWQVSRAEKEGKSFADDKLKTLKVTIEGDRIRIKDGDFEDSATIRIDPARKPATIDFVPVDDEKAVAPGIYAFEGETLKLCWTRIGGERPKEFTSRFENDTRLFVLIRGK